MENRGNGTKVLVTAGAAKATGHKDTCWVRMELFANEYRVGRMTLQAILNLNAASDKNTTDTPMVCAEGELGVISEAIPSLSITTYVQFAILQLTLTSDHMSHDL